MEGDSGDNCKMLLTTMAAKRPLSAESKTALVGSKSKTALAGHKTAPGSNKSGKIKFQVPMLLSEPCLQGALPEITLIVRAKIPRKTVCIRLIGPLLS